MWNVSIFESRSVRREDGFSLSVLYCYSVSMLGPTLVVGDDDVIGEDVMDDEEAEVMDETEEVRGYW